MIEEGTVQEFKRSVLTELPALPKVGQFWRMEAFGTKLVMEINAFEYDLKRGCWCYTFVTAGCGLIKDGWWHRLPVEDFMERIENGTVTRIL